MTTSDTSEAVILVDTGPDDGYIENTGWVAVTDDCRTPEQALRLVEDALPIEDRPEEEVYVCDGERVWLRPVTRIEAAEVDMWEDCEPRDRGAREFLVVKVVCPA